VLKKVGLVIRPNPPALAQQLYEAFDKKLKEQGVEVWRGSMPDTGAFGQAVKELDLVFAFGGDGTILSTAKIAAPHSVPITGVDFGRLGFLAELDPKIALDQIPAFVRREYWLEERAMLQAQIIRQGEVIADYLALNDIVIGRAHLSGVIDVTVNIDNTEVTTYIGDGVIVSTATGSTAYSLAVGGPVIAPTMRVVTLSAIAPHLSLLGHMIVPETSTVRLHVGTRKGAAVTVDGSPDESVMDKDVVLVRNSPHSSQFARLQPANYFYETLATRLRRGG
jgi:NAD+ kinase